MPEGAVKEKVEYPCRGHQNGQRIRLGFLAGTVQMRQAQNLWCERGHNDIDRKASKVHNRHLGRRQNRLPTQFGNRQRHSLNHYKAPR